MLPVEGVSTVRAYKRSPALSISTWHKGILFSDMAGNTDNKGAFDLIIIKMRRGTEPPPHVHSREDELFYLLSGEMKVYVDGEVFTVIAGECMFLPRRKLHAFLVTSEEVHYIALLVPRRFLDAVSEISAPAEQKDVPTAPDTVTYGGFEEFLKATAVPAPDNAVAPTEPPAIAGRNVFELASDYGIQFG